jgi:uncharacterized protein YajQ (UPF0234 family)
MPSFDIVSEIDLPELNNAIDQANKELKQRFDFKGTDAVITMKDKVVTLEADSDFQINQMRPMLYQKMTKRNVDVACVETKEIRISGKRAKQDLSIQEGIDQPLAKKIIKLIKDKKLKVQAQIQAEQVRVTGKKRDDLQTVMAVLRAEEFDMPLQYQNFRD